MDIINRTPEIGELKKEGTTYIYELGTIPLNIPVKFELGITGETITNSRMGCGSCTKGENSTQDGNSIQKITYDSKQKGVFTKKVSITTDKRTISLTFKGISA